MAENNKKESALTYPDWSMVGRSPERPGNLRIFGHGDVAQDHHITEDLTEDHSVDDPAAVTEVCVPQPTEAKPKTKEDDPRKKAIEKMEEEGFERFAEEHSSKSRGDIGDFVLAILLVLAVATVIALGWGFFR